MAWLTLTTLRSFVRVVVDVVPVGTRSVPVFRRALSTQETPKKKMSTRWVLVPIAGTFLGLYWLYERKHFGGESRLFLRRALLDELEDKPDSAYRNFGRAVAETEKAYGRRSMEAASVTARFASFCAFNNRPKEAGELFSNAFQTLVYLKNWPKAVAVAQEIVPVLQQLDFKDQAEQLLKWALSLAADGKIDSTSRGALLEQLGSLYLQANQTKEALSMYKEAEPFLSTNPCEVSSFLINLGSAYIGEDQLHLANETLNKARQIAEKDCTEHLAAALHALGQLNEVQGNTAAAFILYSKALDATSKPQDEAIVAIKGSMAGLGQR